MGTDSGQFSRRSALGLIGAAAGGVVLGQGGRARGATRVTREAASPAGAGRAFGQAAVAVDPVELVDNGPTVTLSNGLVSATVTKATAQTTSLRLIGSQFGNQDFN